MCGNPQAVLGADPGEAGDHVFLLCFFFFFLLLLFPFCTHEYDSAEHKLITFAKRRIVHRKRLGSHLPTPAARPEGGGVGWSRIYVTVLTKTAADLRLQSCETQLLVRGAEMIHVSSSPFGFGVSLGRFTNCRCFFKRSLPHFPADFTHPIKL